MATKFLPRTQEEIAAGITGQQHIRNMIDTSLRNLGLDYVDLYIYHMWDYETPLYDIMDGLNRIVQAGKARYIGISNCFAYQLAKANALAWLLTKVTAPVVGATKLHHIEGAAKALALTLTPEEIAYLEEPYVPHRLVGVMAQNTPAAAKERHVWCTGSQKIQGR